MNYLSYFLFVINILLLSCSNFEIEESYQGQDDVHSINLVTSTTRSDSYTLESLVSSDGFQVYATKTAASPVEGASKWYIENENYLNKNYESPTADPSWSWGKAGYNPQWPIAKGYPMHFYSYFPKEAPVASPPFEHQSGPSFKLDASGENLKGVYNISWIVAGSGPDYHGFDFLASKAVVLNAKPPSGKVNMDFEHIMSKVRFSIKVGKGLTVYIHEIKMDKLYAKSTYDYITGEWAPAKDHERASLLDGQSFYVSHYNKDITADQVYTELKVGPTTSDADVISVGKPKFLMPQSLETWRDAEGNIVPPSDMIRAHSFTITYRIEDASGKDILGFGARDDYPVDSRDSSTPGGYALFRYPDGVYKGPLYVQGIFGLGDPKGAELSFEKGKSYNIIVPLGVVGATGGYLGRDTYLSAKSDVITGIVIEGEPDRYTHVSDGEIFWNVEVEEW